MERDFFGFQVLEKMPPRLPGSFSPWNQTRNIQSESSHRSLFGFILCYFQTPLVRFWLFPETCTQHSSQVPEHSGSQHLQNHGTHFCTGSLHPYSKNEVNLFSSQSSSSKGFKLKLLAAREGSGVINYTHSQRWTNKSFIRTCFLCQNKERIYTYTLATCAKQ